MDFSAIGNIFTLPFIIFCVMIYLGTQTFRYIVEFIAKRLAGVSHFIVKLLKKVKIIEKKVTVEKVDKSFEWFWRENVLPITPLLIGGLMGFFIAEYPYPDQFKETVTSRTFVGIFAGLICVFLYPRLNFYFKKFANKKLDEAEEKVKSASGDDSAKENSNSEAG